MIDRLTIQIPYDLARYAVCQRRQVNKYDTNQEIKALDTWLVLKAEAPGSLIQSWNKQKAHLLQLCKVSETIFRHRLQVLIKMQLLQIHQGNLRLSSWDTMSQLLSIDVNKKFTIDYEINNTQKVHQWLIATEIKDNQSRQAYMILKRLNKNPEIAARFTAALLKAGADKERLKDADYFLCQLKAMYLQDFVEVSEIHDDLIEVRPDTNRGVKKMAATWNAKHAVTVSYWKQVLRKAGIIDVSKMQIESTTTTRNPYCRVIWLNTKNIKRNFPERKALQTLLVMCDQITILQPWLIKKFLLAA